MREPDVTDVESQVRLGAFREGRDMSVSVMIEGTVKDMDAFEALLLKGLPATRSYEGCEGLTVHRNMDEPANVVLVER